MKITAKKQKKQIILSVSHDDSRIKYKSDLTIDEGTVIERSHLLELKGDGSLKINCRPIGADSSIKIENNGIFNEFKDLFAIVNTSPHEKCSTIKLNIDKKPFRPIAFVGNPRSQILDESFFSPIEDLNGNKFKDLSINKALISKLETFRDELIGFLKELETNPFSWDILNDVDLDPTPGRPGIPYLLDCTQYCFVLLIIAVIAGAVSGGSAGIIMLIAYLVCVMVCIPVIS